MSRLRDPSLQEQLKDYPCSFNLDTAGTVTLAKLKATKIKLVSEIKNDDGIKSESIRRKNLLSWIYFCLGKEESSVSLSNELICLTQCKNIPTLANRCFILNSTGDELEVKRCQNCLRELKKNKVNFSDVLIEAKAEQAYYYRKLGGFKNLNLARKLLLEVVAEKPENYLWKYDLGLVYRRFDNANIFCFSPDPHNVDKYVKDAASYLFEAADKGEGRLKAMAYAQLITMQEIYMPDKFPEISSLFRGIRVIDLIKQALVYGHNVSSVLTCCGKALCWRNVDESIDLLQKSIEIRPATMSYHYLGKSYKRKAQLIYTKNYIPRKTLANTFANKYFLFSQNAESRHSSCFSRTGSDPTGALYNQDRQHNRVSRQLSGQYNETLPAYTQDVSYNIGGASYLSHKYHSNRGRGFHIKDRRNWAQQEMSPSEYKIRNTLRQPTGEPYLNKDDEHVKKAIESFNKAITLLNENFGAILDLGILLKEVGDTEEALKQFNKITYLFDQKQDNIITVISAFEQAGQCYLKLSKTHEMSSDCEERGKKKLMQAVSLAASLAQTMSELQGKEDKLWTAFQVLMNKIDEKVNSSQDQFVEKVQLLKLARKHKEIVDQLSNVLTFSGDVDKYEEMVVLEINSCLKLNQSEKALAFLHIIAIRPDVSNSVWWNRESFLDLRVQVLLQAISGRLESEMENPTMLFQQIFKIMFGLCSGTHESKELEMHGNYVGDVLVVFDDDNDDDDKTADSIKSIACCLKQVAFKMFGLDSEENLQRNYEFGHNKYETQLLEMKKYQVVIIVLGNETRDPMFDSMLKSVARTRSTEEENKQRIIVVDAGIQDGKFPLCLSYDDCFKLEDIVHLGDIGQCHGGVDNASYMDIVKNVFHGDIKAVLKLFSFIVGYKGSC